MGKPILFVTRRMPPAVEARIARDYTGRLNPDDCIYGPEELIAGAAGADAMLICASDRLDSDLAARLPATIRVIATYSVGHEHIDVPAFRARGIAVANTPGAMTDATADIALLLILGAARRGYEAQQLVRNGLWQAWTTTMLLGVDLAGKRLGIFGMGRIGQAVARRARGFGMAIHYHGRNRLPQDLELGAQYHSSLDDLLSVSDILSVNAPSTPQTRRCLDHARLALLPAGAIVVNTARGDLIDDDALIAALKTGHLMAAGLDVFAGEPKLDPRYLDLPNVYLLPHIGSATVETRDRMGFMALDNIAAVLAGNPAPNAL